MDSKQTHFHVFEDTVVPPTCKERGYTLHKCHCGYEHRDSFKPLGDHLFLPEKEVAPSCEQKGSRSFRCAHCGEVVSQEIAPVGHAWGPWNVQAFATCTEGGKEICICTRCGQTQERVVPPKGHQLSAPKKSATEKGVLECFCANCGETVTVPTASARLVKLLSRHKKALIASAISLFLVIGLTLATFLYFIPAYRYSCAKECILEGDYTEAYLLLRECDGFDDSRELLKDFFVYYEETVTANYGEDGDITLSFKYEYNEKGDLLRQTSYYKDGSVSGEHRYEYEYNEDGDLTQQTEHGTGYDGKPYTHVYSYVEDGNVTRVFRQDEEGNTLPSQELRYDKDGNVIYSAYYDENGILSSENKEEYDGEGRRIRSSWAFYNDDGSLWLKEELVYEYDEDGNMVREIRYDEDGNVWFECEYEYEYDEDGNMVRQIQYNQGGNVQREYEFEYDEDGFLRRRLMYEGGILLFTEENRNPRVLYVPQK